jgi:hypothetical protein
MSIRCALDFKNVSQIYNISYEKSHTNLINALMNE